MKKRIVTGIAATFFAVQSIVPMSALALSSAGMELDPDALPETAILDEAFATLPDTGSLDLILDVNDDVPETMDSDSILQDATETIGENASDDGARQDFDESYTSGLLDLSIFYDKVSTLDMTAFGKLKYEVPTSVESTAFLNLQYSTLLSKFTDMGHGSATALEVPKFESGYAESIVDRFTSTFGDMSIRKQTEVSLPAGWSMSEIMSEVSGLRDEVLGDFKNSDAYKTILGDISTGLVFENAQNALQTPPFSFNMDPNGGSTSGGGSNGGGTGGSVLQGAASSGSMHDYTTKDYQTMFDDASGNQAGMMQSQLFGKVESGLNSSMLNDLQNALSGTASDYRGKYESNKVGVDDVKNVIAGAAGKMADIGNALNGQFIAGEWVYN